MQVMRRIVEASIIFIALVFLVIVLKNLASFIRPFFFAIIVMFALMPLIKWSQRKRIPFSVTMLGVVLLIISIISLLGILITLALGEGDELTDEITDEITSSDKDVSFADQYMQIEIFGKYVDLSETFKTSEINEFIGNLVSYFIKGVGSLFSEIFMVILFTIFLIPARRSLIATVHNSINIKQRVKFNKALLQIEDSIKNYLYTKTLISLGTTVCCGIVLLLFGSKYIIILSLIIFILNYIPAIGSFVSTGIAIIIYALVAGIGWQVIAVAILLTAVQQLFGSYLEPKFAGTKLKLNPIILLLSLFLWSWVWGIIGMLIAVPLTSIIKIILANTESTKKIAEFMS
jgi:AI-2 transport protein TqsA